MKQFILGVACLLSVASFGSEPGKDYGMAGCGLGSEAFGTSGQIFAATTNGTSWNQLFAISSGTSNCVPEGGKKALLEQHQFLYGNLSTLEREISQGDGETLKAYSDVLGCEPSVYPQFAVQLQKNYRQVFSKPGASSVLEATKSAIREDSTLSKACAQIG